MFKTGNYILKTNDKVLLKYKIDTNYLLYVKATTPNTFIDIHIANTSYTANDFVNMMDSNGNITSVPINVTARTHRFTMKTTTDIYKFYLSSDDYDKFTHIRFDLYNNTNCELTGYVGDQWSLLSLTSIVIRNRNNNLMKGYGLLKLKTYSNLMVLSIHATNIKLEIDKLKVAKKIRSYTVGDISQTFDAIDIVDINELTTIVSENRTTTNVPKITTELLLAPKLSYVSILFNSGNTSSLIATVTNKMTFFLWYNAFGNIVFTDDSIPMGIMTISYLSATTVVTAPYHIFKQTTHYLCIIPLTGNIPIDYKINPNQPEYDIDLYNYSKNKICTYCYIVIHTSYIPTRQIQLTTLIRSRDIKSLGIIVPTNTYQSYYIFDYTLLSADDIIRLNNFYYSYCLDLQFVSIDLDCSIIQNNTYTAISLVACIPYINGITNLNMLLTRATLKYTTIVFTNTTMLNSQINGFIDLLFTNRNLFTNNNILKYLKVVGLTTNGIYRIPTLGTYTGNINDLTENQIDNLANGLDYTGGGSNTPWTVREKMYILVNMAISSTNTIKRYKWSIAY